VRRADRRRRQRGFTLIELMVALVVSTLLIGLILSIFARMSLAYRSQQNVAELQQILAAAHAQIGRDLRQAGFGMADGFFIAADQTLHQPVEVINNADGFGPDEIRVFTADASAEARVLSFNSDVVTDAFTSLVVDEVDDFVDGDVAVIVKSEGRDDQATLRYHACVVQIETIAGTTFNIDGAGSWGSADNDQCDELRDATVSGSTMIYRFKARAYRIDPTRLDLAVLQVSTSGDLLANDWQDLGIGFTDLQVATRWYEGDDDSGLAAVDTADLDADPLREWYSGDNQATLSAPLVTGGSPYLLNDYDQARPRMTAVRVSLAVRTHTRIDSVPTSATPKFQDDARVDNNELGDRDAFDLDGTPDASRPTELKGDNIYRYATVGSDLRNLAVGK